MEIIDQFLNKITMYRLVLYYCLLPLLAIAVILSTIGVLHYNPLFILFSALVLIVVCWSTNRIFAWAFAVQDNVESYYITALILAFIISPLTSLSFSGIAFLVFAGIVSQASKYIIAIHKKHIFNPAALAVVVTSFTISGYASWWIATAWMLPFVAIAGFLIVRKIRREDFVLTFLAVAVVTIVTVSLTKNADPLLTIKKTLVDLPLIFFATIMLTEPLTMPPTKGKQLVYAILVGLLYEPQFHFGSVHSTPEIALIVGNVFSYLVSPKEKLLLTLQEVKQLTADTYNFVFSPNRALRFAPGQYLEWTLGHNKPDSRGNRRYFTISSSPTEPTIGMGVKFYEPASSFKTALKKLQIGKILLAGQLAGDFTLPKNTQQKLVFVAGGIGITPFVSMIKFLIDTKEQRDIVLLYTNRTAQDIAYKDVFDSAAQTIGLKTIYVLTRPEQAPNNWPGPLGYITPETIHTHIPDFKNRVFYISGPQRMVDSLDHILQQSGIAEKQIKKDFFPGF